MPVLVFQIYLACNPVMEFTGQHCTGRGVECVAGQWSMPGDYPADATDQQWHGEVHDWRTCRICVAANDVSTW